MKPHPLATLNHLHLPRCRVSLLLPPVSVKRQTNDFESSICELFQSTRVELCFRNTSGRFHLGSCCSSFELTDKNQLCWRHMTTHGRSDWNDGLRAAFHSGRLWGGSRYTLLCAASQEGGVRRSISVRATRRCHAPTTNFLFILKKKKSERTTTTAAFSSPGSNIRSVKDIPHSPRSKRT